MQQPMLATGDLGHSQVSDLDQHRAVGEAVAQIGVGWHQLGFLTRSVAFELPLDSESAGTHVAIVTK